MNFSDFLTTDNLIFFGVIVAVLVLLLAICFVIIRAIFRFIKSLFKKEPKEQTVEGVMVNKGEDLGVYVKELEKSRKEGAKVQSLKQSASTLKYDQPTTKRETKKEVNDGEKQDWSGKEQKDIEEGLDKLKGIKTEEDSFLRRQTSSEKNEDEHQKIKIPVAKKFGNISEVDEQDSPKLEKNDGKDQILVPQKTPTIQKNYTEGQKSDISVKETEINKENRKTMSENDNGSLPQNLEKLAEDRASQKESSNGQQKKVEAAKGNVINREAKIDNGSLPQNLEKLAEDRASQKESPDGQQVKPEISKFEKPEFMKNNLRWKSGSAERLREESKWKRAKRIKEPDTKNTKGKLPQNLEDIAKARVSNQKHSNTAKEDVSFFAKPKITKESGLSPKKTVNLKQEGGVIFKDKQELTRRQLKYKLRKDPKVYKAAKESLLNLSPTERANLEKQFFSGTYGLNISKSDVKTRMHKLSQEMLNEKRPQAKSTIRKEIKFMKKISGIK